MHIQRKKGLLFAQVAFVALLLTLSFSLISGAVAAQAKSSTSSFSLHPQNSAAAKEEDNKGVVLQVYQQILNRGKTDLVSHFFAPDFIQHDPTISAGQQGVLRYVQKIRAQHPAPLFVVKHLLADGDFVAVHSQLTATPGNEMTGQASLDLYRVIQGVIVEHWNTTQQVPTTTVNGHSMFSNLYPYQGTPPPVTGAQEGTNKEFVTRVYNALVTGAQTGVVDTYWNSIYLQHNPTFPDGTADLKQAFSTPGSNLDIRYAVAQGDLVFTYSQLLVPGSSLQSDFTTVALSDLFRVVNGKIVEHWDVVQAVPATTANGNSMFSDLYSAEN